MDAASNSVAEEQDNELGIDQQDVLYRMVLFLATVTVRLFSRVLGADNAPFRPVMSKRGTHNQAIGRSRGGLTIVALVDALSCASSCCRGSGTTASVSPRFWRISTSPPCWRTRPSMA